MCPWSTLRAVWWGAFDGLTSCGTSSRPSMQLRGDSALPERILLDIGGKVFLYDVQADTLAPTQPARGGDLLHVYYAMDDRATSDEHRLDLRCLARVLFPELPEHAEQRVREHLGLKRTTSAARDLVAMLEAILAEASTLGRESRWLLERLLPQTEASILGQLAEVASDPREGLRRLDPLSKPTARAELPVSASDALSLGGTIAAGLPNYEERAGQRRMTIAVDQCLAEGGALVVDAPPGIGKTFAYLVPVLLHLQRHPEERVVVSTRTRQLQEQLYLRDLPYLGDRLAPGLKMAILKGRENYLCLRRWERFIQEQLRALPWAGRSAAALLVRW
ncbi:MAG TPA: DEAD/DEAH box helicase, partial [Candidatus Acetothermia bacterium]|nr:DEAD/DEAH box helicase [Candidatus Acetothermia bacterium]